MFSLSPARRRWTILALIFFAMVLNYVDRQIVSVLKPTIKSEFAIDDTGYATLINVFMVCYAGMYPLAGWLADRFGAGRMMLIGIAAWSSACMGAAFTRTFAQLAVMRGALGFVEPLAFPAQLRIMTVWFPPRLRATANSVCSAGSTVGATIAPMMVAALALAFGWRSAFVIPASIGLLISLLWLSLYRDPPTDVMAESIAAAEPTKLVAFTWPQLWKTRSLWGIVAVRFVSDPVWYFCLFWLPGYLQERSGLSLQTIGRVGWIPFLAADLGGIATSMLSDRLVRRGTAPLRARKLVLTGAAVLAPVCIFTPHLPNPITTLAIFSIIGPICLTWLFNLGVVVAESFPAPNVGSVWGIAAGFGALGSILFNFYIGQIMQSVGSARIFLVMGFLHPAAVLILWTCIRRERAGVAAVS